MYAKIVNFTHHWHYACLQIAKRQGVVNPENTFFSVKRFIGRKMAEVKDESKGVPYVLVDASGAVKIKSGNAKKDFSPEEISAQVLRKLVDDAAKFLNDKVYAALVMCTSLAMGQSNCLEQSLCCTTMSAWAVYSCSLSLSCIYRHLMSLDCLELQF